MSDITVYGLSTCPWCKKTRALFTKSGVAFDYVDYDLADDVTQARIMGELDGAGATGFPFTRIDDQVVLGYQPARFAELMGGAREARP